MHKSSMKSAKVFHEKDATRISEKVGVLKQVGEERRLISVPAMGQRQRRAVYGKSVRTVR